MTLLAAANDWLVAPKREARPIRWEETLEVLNSAGVLLPTETQAEIILDIAGKVHDKLHAALSGPAGTGKTTLLAALITLLAKMKYHVQLAAFTHKACSVLESKLDVIRDSLGREADYIKPAVTLHRLLNLKPRAAKYGEKETFAQGKVPSLDRFDVIIVDECSMIGEDLYNYIDKDVRKPGISLLYAGDACQLRPVGEARKSKTFTAPTTYKLTQVLRHDGAILDLATKIRTARFIPQFSPAAGDNSRVVLHDSVRVLGKAWEEQLKTSPEDAVMLTFMNANRKKYNERAREVLHGADAPRFMKDDYVLALSPIMRDEEIMFNNNESIHIVDEPRIVYKRPVRTLDFEYQCWALPTKLGMIYTLVSSEEKRFWSEFKKLGKDIAAGVKAAGASVQHVREAKLRWSQEYFPMKNFFADVDFHYALTIHKSQGSTFKTVFLNDDYLKAREDQKRLLYVAVTRASHEVHLVDNRH